MKRKAIIKALKDAPQVWNAEDFDALETATGERITRAELQTARALDASPLLKHLSDSIAENIERTRGADFPERLRILEAEILPAIDYMEETRRRIERATAADI